MDKISKIGWFTRREVPEEVPKVPKEVPEERYQKRGTGREVPEERYQKRGRLR